MRSQPLALSGRYERTQKLAQVVADLLARSRDSGVPAGKSHYGRIMSEMDVVNLLELVCFNEDQVATRRGALSPARRNAAVQRLNQFAAFLAGSARERLARQLSTRALGRL